MTEHYIRPDVSAYLAMLAQFPRPDFSDEFVAMMRQLPPDAMPPMDLPVGDLGEIRDLTMAGPAGDIALRLFDPRATRGPSPVMVFYHGGGFVVGSIDSHASLCAEIARSLDLPVVSVEYRLAPENPWPAGPDDAEAAARWIAGNGAAFGREFTGLVLCGDSAGGNLAAITAAALRDQPAALPVLYQLLIYPVTDSSRRHPSRDIFAEGFGLDAKNIAYFDRAYAMDKHHWRGSPILADTAGLPPALVVTAGLDPLRDQGRRYGAALIQAGVDVDYREMRGSIHGFVNLRKAAPSTQADTHAIFAAMKLMLARVSA